jgi:hypothetical protein
MNAPQRHPVRCPYALTDGTAALSVLPLDVSGAAVAIKPHQVRIETTPTRGPLGSRPHLADRSHRRSCSRRSNLAQILALWRQRQEQQLELAVAIGFLRLDPVETLTQCQEQIVSTIQNSKQNTRTSRQTSGTVEWAMAQVAAAPPLTEEQYCRLRQVLGGLAQGRDERSAHIEPEDRTLGNTA